MRVLFAQGLIASTALVTVSLALSPIAAAQNADNDDPAPPVEAAGEPGDLRLTPLTVTATLSEQSLQDIPIAVTAFPSEDLERMGIVAYTDLAASIPNFSFDSLTNAGFTIPSLRGIGLTGSTQSAISNNPATGVYVDGVYLNSAGANLFNVLDVERIEVLRGPQGTLYGRNTIGGVINIVSKEPTDELQGNLSATVGNFNLAQVSGSVSGPLAGDKLLGRIGVTSLNRDGYVKNNFSMPNAAVGESAEDTDSLESIALRGSLLFRPSDELDITFAADYSRDDTTYPGFNVEDGASPDLSMFLGPSAAAYTDTDGDVHEVSYNANNDERAINWGGALTGEWTSGDLRLVSITGYRESIYLDDLSDIDGTPVNIYQQFLRLEESSKSQEFRAHFDTDRWNIVGGIFYYGYEAQQDIGNDILGVERDLGYPLSGGMGPGLLGGGTTRSVTEVETESYSAFGNATFALTDRLDIQGGLRWTNTTADFSRPVSRAELGTGASVMYNGGVPFDEVPADVLLFDLGDTFTSQEKTFSRVSPSLSANYHYTDDVMFYASWSRGFREGGFASAPSNASGILPFQSETLTSYEFGAKSTLFDGRLMLNAAAYYYDYTDQQVEVPSISTAGVTIDIFNSGESRAQGVEVEFLGNITEYFELQGSLGFQDTEFTKLEAGVLGDLSGNQFPRAPEVSAALSPKFTLDVSDYGTLTIQPQWSYQSSEFMTVDNDPNSKAKSRNLFDATAEFTPNDAPWSASIWARNITDEEYINKVVDLTSFLGYRLRRYGAPATFGATFKYNF
ncbi:MAG: TonB-dependent receptor [Hyphomonadaceae bacterium]|nr:TonB-dependent receptor [Hyphomonadaceae bacterium]